MPKRGDFRQGNRGQSRGPQNNKNSVKSQKRKQKEDWEDAFEELEPMDEEVHEPEEDESPEEDDESPDGLEEMEGAEEDYGDNDDGEGDEEDGEDEDNGAEEGDEELEEEGAEGEGDEENVELQGSIGEYDAGEDEDDRGEDRDLKDKLKAKKNEKIGPAKVTLEERRRKLLRTQVNHVKNKDRRLKLLDKRKAAMQTLENKRRRELRKQNKVEPQKMMKPITIEDARQVNKSFLFSREEEVEADERCDEFAGLFSQEITPKVLITTDENPSRHIFEFIKEMRELIPNSYFYARKKFPLATICRLSSEREFTHVLVVRERLKQPYQMIAICLPIGPSIVFRLSSVKLRKELQMHGAPTGHKPELILKNFNTANGRRVGRFLGSMFDQDPEFKARTVVSFLNMRDYIFVRHHRYVFKEKGTKVGLQEIGPRFTIKVSKILEGTFEKHARIEWIARDDMYSSRKAVFM